MRILLLIGGIALLVSGGVAAFIINNGTATAALLRAGFVIAFPGYIGEYITRIKFRDFEAKLERVRRKAVEALDTLSEVARSCEAIRTGMPPGGARDADMDRLLPEATRRAVVEQLTDERLRELLATKNKGDRI